MDTDAAGTVNPFYRHAFVFTAASLTASAVNYLYYPVMARLMGVVSYGELQLITSFILQLTTVYLTLNIINVNIVANHEETVGRRLMTALQKTIFWLVVILCVGLALASVWLRDFFHFSSAVPFLLIVPILLIDTASIFWTGYLQGHREFKTLSLYTVGVAGSKLFFSVGLVVVGLGVSGGVLGIAASLAFGLVLVRLASRRSLPALLPTLSLPTIADLRVVRGNIVYVVEVLTSLVSMGILLSVDVIIVKHYFSPEFAGHYAGIATVARIIYFATAPLVMVMLPSIKLGRPAANRAAFRRTLGLCALVCIGGLTLFSVAAHPIIALLMGPAFVAYSNWLPLISIIAVLFTFTNLAVNYLLALRSHWSIVVSLASLTTGVLLIVWHHATVPQIVASASIGLLIGQLIFWLSQFMSRPGRRQSGLSPH